MARLGTPATLAESCGRRRSYRLLVVSVCISGLRQGGREVQVDGLNAWIAVPLSRETERRRAKQAPAFAGAARAGVGAGGRGGVNAISHSPRGRGGGEGLLPLAGAAAEDWQA